jgi:hypothetical protein
MDFILFIISIIMFAIIGGAMAYIIFYNMVETGMLILIMIIAACCGGSLAAIYSDEVHTHDTLVCGSTNLTIVDTFQEGTFWGDRLIAKLNDGFIIQFGDPFKWKRIKEGDLYPVITASAHSYINGNITMLYHYSGDAPKICQMEYMNGEL